MPFKSSFLVLHLLSTKLSIDVKKILTKVEYRHGTPQQFYLVAIHRNQEARKGEFTFQNLYTGTVLSTHMINFVLSI